MRSMDSHLMCQDKVNDSVSHYIAANQQAEVVSSESSSLSILDHNDDSTNRIVTVMQPATFTPQLCRQLVVNGETTITEWSEELLGTSASSVAADLTDEEGRLAAALVAHLSNQFKTSHHHQLLHDITGLGKSTSQRTDPDQVALVDGQLRLFNSQQLNEQSDSLEIEINSLPTLPPLTHMKRVPIEWLQKNKEQLRQRESPVTNLASTSKLQPNRKSLPHKKRISKRLRKVAMPSNQTQVQEQDTPDRMQQNEQCGPPAVASHVNGHHADILFVNCVRDEQILPDAFTAVRPIFICQLCNEFFGEEQLKFYHHLKQHYEPNNATIIIENPVAHHLPMEKMSSNCLTETEVALAELGLDKPEFYRQQVYSNSESLYLTSKVTYTTATECQSHGVDPKTTQSSIKEVFCCDKCGNAFKSKRHMEHHKCEELNEFSEPEDLMEGISVIVESDELQDRHPQQRETADMNHFLPQISAVESSNKWYVRPGCAECGAGRPYHLPECSLTFKEEVLRRILESTVEVEISSTNNNTADTPTQPDETREVPVNQQDKFIPKLEILSQGQTQERLECTLVRDEATQTRASAANPETQPQDSSPVEEAAKSSRGDAPDAIKMEAKNSKKGKQNEKALKMYPCMSCEKVFKRKNSLVYHILSHSNTRPYACDLCEKAFYTSAQLKIHKRVHSGDRPYKCELCSKNFRQWGDLKYHIASIHETKKKFKCEHCGKQFARKYSLNLHLRTHTGEKNYKCTYCEKAFSASSYRQVHMRTHTGDKPHKCGECGKGFRCAGDLRRHIRIHIKHKQKLTQQQPP